MNITDEAPQGKSELKESTHFECIICLSTAKEPIVTKCGHLYCWPCIYNWIDQNNENQKKTCCLCPLCKDIITIESLIPIYNKDEHERKINRFSKIPERPKAKRMEEGNNLTDTERQSILQQVGILSWEDWMVKSGVNIIAFHAFIFLILLVILSIKEVCTKIFF